jgi:hypothetical protein
MGQYKEDPWWRRYRGILCTDSMISEQGSALAYAVTEWSETGKLNDLCSSWVLGSVRFDVKSR